MSGCPFRQLTRRGFFKAVGGLGLFAAGAPLAPHALVAEAHGAEGQKASGGSEPFFGPHQAGIVTPQQQHTYFASFDLQTQKRGDIVAMLKAWTEASARMTQGRTAGTLTGTMEHPAGDGGDSIDLPASRLTLTFGFGAGLFVKDGKDRYGLGSKRPEALVDMPKFNGDQLIDARSDGDISVQACADSPQVAFHAVRQLARLAGGTAQLRWAQTGFVAASTNGETPRNLMGFKDGTKNPTDHNKFVWVGAQGPGWMRGGSYLVVRRIRIALEHWDNTGTAFQEQVIGRRKDTGAGLGGTQEFEPLNLAATDKEGNPVIPENAHVRLANEAMNNGAQILRRGYSYNDGANFVADRWPPWRQGIEYDAGLFFVSYQNDPRTGFIPIFTNMAKLDALNQFVTHTGSGLFACPGGVRQGEYIGQRLFEAA